MFLMPFYVLFVLVVIGIPVRMLIEKLPEKHWLRRFLLLRIS